MCACRLGACEINNNRPKKKTPSPRARKAVRPAACDSSSEWTDSESESCSGCSACFGSSSSSCSCSECNMETDSSGGGGRGPRGRKPAPVRKPSQKQLKNSGKILRCRDGVCEWVSKKKVKKPTKTKKSVPANSLKGKKPKGGRKCYDCC